MIEASLNKRFIAFGLDLLFMFVLFILCLVVIQSLQKIVGLFDVQDGFLYIIKLTLNFMVLLSIYIFTFALIPSFNGKTVGKMILQLRVVPTAGKLTFGRMLFREILLKHIFYGLGLGIIIDLILVGLFKKVPVHDELLQTKVV